LSFGLGILFIVLIIARGTFLFLWGTSFGRMGIPLDGKVTMYDYNWKKYQYKLEKDGNLLYEEELNIQDLFELWYRIHTDPNTKLIYETNGEMTVIYGPPFTLQLSFFRLNHEVKYIHFNKCEIVNSYNLLEIEKMYIINDISEFGSTVGGKHEKLVAVNLFKESKNLYVHRSTNYISAIIRDELINNKDSEIKETIIKNSIITGVQIGFQRLPINYEAETEIEILIDFDVIMINGKTENFKFRNIYKLDYEENKLRNWFAPETYDHQKDE
jgi:hypothetical protein